MHHLKNKISTLLLIVLLQFTAPILNVVAELPCCENQQMQCCRPDFPARIVCCVGEPAHGFDESAPSQMALQQQNTLQIALLFAPIAFISEPNSQPESLRSTVSNLLNSSLYDNDLYQRLSTLLI